METKELPPPSLEGVDSLTMPSRVQSRITQRREVWLFAAAVVFCSGACSPDRSPTSSLEPPPVTLTIGVPTAIGQDPLYGVTQASRLVSFEGLSGQNLSGRPVPRLAERWAEASDGMAWTIWLRRSAVFHDGSPVDAKAVKQSLETFLKTGSGRFPLGLHDVASIEIADTHTLIIRLKQRSTLLLDNLDTPITKLDANGLQIGTGPYVVTSTSPDQVLMSAFPQYYRAQPTIKRLAWKLYPTVRTAWAATMRGEVDFLYEVGPESREFLEFERSVELYSFLRNYVYGLVFNSNRPFFRDQKVRTALNYAVDRHAIIERAFRGHATIAHGPAWPLHWAHNSDAPVFLYDPARAVASLRGAAAKGATRETLVGLKFACLIPQNFQLWERLALMVQRDLAEIGVEMVLESVPFDEFNQRVATGTFDAILTEMISGFSASRPFYFWHSSASANYFGYRNDAVDAAFDGMKSAANESEYRRAYSRFQQATFEDPPAIFLAWGQTARAVSRRFDVVRSDFGDIRTTIAQWNLAEPARAPN